MVPGSPERSDLFAMLETEFDGVAESVIAPRPRECLPCYVWRMLNFGCHGHFWLKRYRDLRAPRATALQRRVERQGGYCDCEMLGNVFYPSPWYFGAESSGYSEPAEDGDICIETMPRCLGVRGGSTRSCLLWVDRALPPRQQFPF